MTNHCERTYGYLYDAERTVVEDAASIRRTIRTLIRGGLLPADWRYSVRTDRYAGGAAIRVTATAPRAIYAADPATRDHVLHAETGELVWAWVDRLTVEARAVHDTLDDLHQAHNHDGSDVQTDYFDVKFYGRVELDEEGRRGAWTVLGATA